MSVRNGRLPIEPLLKVHLKVCRFVGTLSQFKAFPQDARSIRCGNCARYYHTEPLSKVRLMAIRFVGTLSQFKP
jgi:hypothetical protein